MALTRGIFIRKDGKNVPSPAGTDPRAARKALAGLVATGSAGVPRAGVFPQGQAQIVVGSAAGMSYQVRAFEGALAREGSDGVVLYANDAPAQVSTAPAPATGSRWDLIYVHYPESTSDTTSSKPVLGCRQGTPSGTPAKPTSLVPAGAYVLAEALVPAGASNTLGVNIIQAWRYTAARGAPIPVRNQAERDEITPSPGTQVLRLDQEGTVEVWAGRWVTSRDWVTPFSFAGGWSSDPSPSRGVLCSWTTDGQIACRASFSLERTAAGFVQAGVAMSHGVILPPHLRPKIVIDTLGLINSAATGPQLGMVALLPDGQLVTIPLPGQSIRFPTGVRINFTASWTTS